MTTCYFIYFIPSFPSGASIAFCASHGYDNCTKSGEYLVRGGAGSIHFEAKTTDAMDAGDYSDEVAELTEDR